MPFDIMVSKASFIINFTMSEVGIYRLPEIKKVSNWNPMKMGHIGSGAATPVVHPESSGQKKNLKSQACVRIAIRTTQSLLAQTPRVSSISQHA